MTDPRAMTRSGKSGNFEHRGYHAGHALVDKMRSRRRDWPSHAVEMVVVEQGCRRPRLRWSAGVRSGSGEESSAIALRLWRSVGIGGNNRSRNSDLDISIIRMNGCLRLRPSAAVDVSQWCSATVLSSCRAGAHKVSIASGASLRLKLIECTGAISRRCDISRYYFFASTSFRRFEFRRREEGGFCIPRLHRPFVVAGGGG